MSDLFRKEALEHQGNKLDGEVIIASHMSFTIIMWLILAIVAIGITYLFLGDYHRKEVVGGYLRPTSGISKVYPIASGVVDEIFVKEGEFVEKEQLLARVRMSRHLKSGGEMNQSILQELMKQENLLKANLENKKSLFSVTTKKLVSQIQGTESQIIQLNKQLGLLSQRLSLSEARYQDMLKLNENNFISDTELQNQRDIFLTLKQQVEDTQARLLSNQENLVQLHYEQEQSPVNYQETLTQIQSSLAGVKQQIAQAEAQLSYDVRSHRSGHVSNVLIKSGMMTQNNFPLMSILPKGATLEAVLFVPTRAYGFVEKGQKTRIRYHAFPYQRFGIYQGEIAEVSKSVVLPGEAQLPIQIQEPVYKVVVKLDEQSAKAYGNKIPLQSGMLLEADIMVDKRSLFEWLFEPIYSIKGAL